MKQLYNTRCLWCFSEDIEVPFFEPTDTSHVASWNTCGTCGQQWQDIYRLVDQVKINEKKGE